MKLKPLVLLLAASVLASGCSQTVKSTLDAPTDVTYQVADEDASGIPIVEPDAALNPATMPTVAGDRCLRSAVVRMPPVDEHPGKRPAVC